MAFSNSYDTTNTGSAVVNREDLSDYVKTLAPEETPILSALPRVDMSATAKDWGVDELDDPNSNGVLEGKDVDNYVDAYAGLARLSNEYQKFRRSWMVSDIQEAVDTAGIPDKVAGAEVKKSREIKRDIEKTIMSANDKVAGTAAVASKMRGLDDWIDSAGPSDVPAEYRTPAASIHASGNFTEAVLNSLITSIFRESGESQGLTLVADTALRREISDFGLTSGATNAVYRNMNQTADGKIQNTVGFYESDHGTVTIVNMNPVCAPDTTNADYGFLLNYSYLKLAELKSLGSVMQPNLGGGQRGSVDWCGTLIVDHPGALGKITVLS